jgi:hypothetical protein
MLSLAPHYNAFLGLYFKRSLLERGVNFDSNDIVNKDCSFMLGGRCRYPSFTQILRISCDLTNGRNHWTNTHTGQSISFLTPI